MKKNAVFNNKNNQWITPDETLKATSLLYFKEALLNEEYEDCEELIRIAKRFGATQSEISGVVAECNRGMKVAPECGAKGKKEGRLRF